MELNDKVARICSCTIVTVRNNPAALKPGDPLDSYRIQLCALHLSAPSWENRRDDLLMENTRLRKALKGFVDYYQGSKRALLGNGYAYKFYAIAEQALSKKPEEK